MDLLGIQGLFRGIRLRALLLGLKARVAQDGKVKVGFRVQGFGNAHWTLDKDVIRALEQ